MGCLVSLWGQHISQVDGVFWANPKRQTEVQYFCLGYQAIKDNKVGLGTPSTGLCPNCVF